MSDNAGPHTTLDLWRAICAPEARCRALVTALCIVIYVAGAKIPAPGLSVNEFRAVAAGTGGSDTLWRLSIFALDINPIFSALILAQVFRLAWPAAATGVETTSGGEGRPAAILLVAALALAAAQAFGLSSALESMDGGAGAIVSEPGPTFRLGYVTTLVAATALLYWLAGLITQHGIGSGFWLLLALPGVAEFWRTGAHLIAAYDRREITLVEISVLVAGILAALALLIAIARVPAGERRRQCPAPSRRHSTLAADHRRYARRISRLRGGFPPTEFRRRHRWPPFLPGRDRELRGAPRRLDFSANHAVEFDVPGHGLHRRRRDIACRPRPRRTPILVPHPRPRQCGGHCGAAGCLSAAAKGSRRLFSGTAVLVARGILMHVRRTSQFCAARLSQRQ